jgi:predicted nucleic-acid-binding protein
MKSLEKVYLVDTNVILRYLLGDHPEFSPRAEVFMLDVSQGVKKAEIPDVVIVECIYVMEKYYEIPKNEIVIDIVDCILAAHSSPEKVVISFDKDMKKLKAVSETL